MPASAKNSAAPDIEERTLVIERVFEAPRALVFQAWTDPVMTQRWMGPKDYPAFHVESDFRIGGKWRIGLRAVEDGRELWQGGVWREIAEPTRLAFTFHWEGGGRLGDGNEPGPETLIEIDFTERDGKTTMRFRQAVFDTRPNRDGHNQGWNSAFDRLAAYLAAL